MRLTDFRVLTFDCYGTLIDWESGIMAALEPLLRQAPRPMPRDEVLQEFARVETAVEARSPAMAYPQVLATVHRHLAEALGVPASPAEADQFGRSVPDWPAFADTVDALRYLKQHYLLVILSNVDRESFAGSNARLGVAFDAVYTAQEIGSYKPDLANFRYMLERLAARGVAASDILHTAQSLFHDHAPANEIGLASAWIDRRHSQEGGGATLRPGSVRYDFRFTGLAEMAAAHRAERAGGQP